MEENSSDHMEQPVQMQTARREPVKVKSKLALIVTVIVILLLASAAFYFLRSGSESEPVEIVNEEVELPTSTPVPTDTPELEIDRSEIKIEVLNGSGVSGEASYFQGILANLGYKDIEIGNAGGDDRDETTVTFAKDLNKGIQDEIVQKLESLYKEVNKKESSSTDFEIEIILGLRKGQSAPTDVPTKAPAATPTKSNTTPTVTPTISATPTP